MLIELTEAELCFIRQAAREFRTAAPEHIASDAGRLSRWRDERELYDQDRSSVDRKMTDALAAIVDRKNG
ncbi:TPA: hypothetical protein ACKQHR_001382 [Pseudomonas aeruginosa]|nr:hypothetical protein [Pseudomonas aeruginosa]